jgi:hypothetical protein
MRSQTITRLYFQVPLHEDIRNWSDEGIWEEMLARMNTDDGWKLERWPDHQQERNADAQFRDRADACRPPLPGRRRGAHRSSDRRQRTNLAAADVLLLGKGARAVLLQGQGRSPDALLVRCAEARLEVATIFLVDDSDTAPVSG